MEEGTDSSDEVTINSLNDDCLLKIFSYLPIKDKIKIERVCKRWEILSNDSWRDMKTLNNNRSTWGFEIDKKFRKKNKNVLENVLERCDVYLTHMDLSGLPVKNKAMENIGELCPNLQCINLGNIAISILKSLALNCHNIRQFKFRSLRRDCTEEHLSEFFRKCTKLECIEITDSTDLTGEFLLSLPKESMVKIILHHSSLFRHPCVMDVFSTFQKLHTLSICRWRYPYRYLPDIYIPVTKLPHQLKILRNTYICRNEINSILSLKQLETLEVSGYHIDDEFLRNLSVNCKELSKLIISENNEISDAGIRAIQALSKLECLSLTKMSITDEAFTYFPVLKKLFFSDCQRLKSDGLCGLIAACDTIERIEFTNCPLVTDDILTSAAKSASLRTNNVFLEIHFLDKEEEFTMDDSILDLEQVFLDSSC